MKTHVLLSSIFLLFAFSLLGQPGASGLVAWYPFNGNANDASGNGNNPTYIGTGVTLTTDRFSNPDKAYSFEGNTGSFIKIPADKMPTTDRTISLWFNVLEVSNRPGLLGYGGNGSCGTSFFMALNCMGGNQYMLQGHCNINQAVYTYSSEPINNWYHWVATIEGNVQKIYVNGELKSTENTFTASTAVAGKDLALGVITYHDGTAPFTDQNVNYLKGKLDDIRIYDKALTEKEVNELYKSESADMVAWYPFNGNANDESGNGNHGTITGPLVTPVADHFGEEGKAYKFGFPDYVSVPTNASFFTDEFTVSYWYKVAAYWGDRSVLSCVGNNGGYHQAFYGTTFQYFLMYNFTNPGDKWFWSNYTVPNTPDTWQHITTTYKKTGDNASITRLYINGELKSSDTHANVIGFPGGEIFYIGRSQGDVGFNGELDDVRFYSRMLTDAEVMELHIAETPTAVKKQIISAVRIAPNPTSGHFAVDLGSVSQQTELCITDLTGRVIKTQKYTGQQLLMVDLEAPAGIYFIQITTSAGQGTFKLSRK